MKESKKYKQQEEETTKVSEPVVAYNSMAYLELEAEKAELIRTIANIDSKEIIDKVKQKLHDVLGLREKTAVKKAAPCQLTEDEIKEEIEQAVDRERMNPKPEPLIPPPVKVSPFTHQVRGYNMALMTFGLVDPPKPKEAEK